MTDWASLIPHLVHDVRTLVRQGVTNSQLVEKTAGSRLDPEVASYLASSIHAQQALNELIGRVGLLAEAESRRDSLDLIDLDTAILAAKVHCQVPLERASGELEVCNVPDCLVSSAVPKIIIELLDNSIRFRHPDRPLRIEIDADILQDGVRISVRDNGASWNAQWQAKLMQPLEKLDGERGGFGLGLAIASALCESCGGTLKGEPGPGGSMFILEVPAKLE